MLKPFILSNIMMKKFSILSVLAASAVLVSTFIYQGTTAFTIPQNVQHRPVTTSTTTRIYAGPAVLEPPVKEKEVIERVDKEEKTESKESYKRGGWAVRLFNDPMNKREFVAMCLSKIVGLSDGQAYQVMMQAHQNGVSVVGRYDLERAELYKTALIDNGLTCDMIPVDDE